MKKVIALFCLIFLCCAGLAQAAPAKPSGAPENLAAWQDWVLYGHEDEYYCPDVNGARRCAWPVTLSLELDDAGGRFTAVFDLLTEGVFTLPGGAGAWPVDVLNGNGLPVPVLGEDTPQIFLNAGRHEVSGRYAWPELPETITVPSGFLLNLHVHGEQQNFPAMETDYSAGSARLWLREAREEAAPDSSRAADSLSVTVNRLILDSQPMVIVNRFRLTVTGQAREVLLDNVLLPESQASFLDSPLPAQLSPAGLRVKVRPGVYEIVLESRSLNRSESVGPAPETSLWGREFWAFQAQPQLRLAEISGAEQIDPSQADIYAPWRNFPIYAPEPGQSLSFNTLRRGDPEAPPDQLNLARECWLDYDGSGLTCRDQLNGTLNRQWHLNTSDPFTLAQATLDGQPQVITKQIDSRGQEAPGLQLRKGQLNLAADLRIDDFNGHLPASGWDHDLETEGQRLNLPPGYQIFHASGADVLQGRGGYSDMPGSWTGSWSTLDFFIVLIIAIAVWKLYGLCWGALALLALIFCYQEYMAPRMVFLHLLACAALLRLLPPKGKVRFLVGLWRGVAALLLIIFASLFLINQARVAIYPQLESPYTWYGDSVFDSFEWPGSRRVYSQDYSYHETAVPAPEPELMEDSVEMEMMAMAPPAPTMAGISNMALAKDRRTAEAPLAQPAQSFANRQSLALTPDAKVQNSLARPDWNWRSVSLYYNGSVSADQNVRLFFISPALGRFLGLIRIGLMGLFTLLMLNNGPIKKRPEEQGDDSAPKKKGFGLFSRPGAALLALALITLPAPALMAAETAFPDQVMLETLRARLLTEQKLPPASFPRAELSLEAERLVLVMEIETARPTAWPLPSLDQEVFRYSRVSLGGESDLPLMMDERGFLFCQAPEGKHRIVLEGRLRLPAGRDSFQINFIRPALPRKVSANGGEAWSVSGLEADGRLRGEALSVTARGGATAVPEEQGTAMSLAPFFIVQRTLSLGLEWQVTSTVNRLLTPSDAPLSVRLPLLPGEQPMGEEFRREGDAMTVNFAPGQESVTWVSRLETGPSITLKAGEGPFTESWALDVSPLWRVKYEGLTPIHSTQGGYWQPAWRPWPGEEVTLSIDRPQPVPGEYRVIDQAGLSLEATENLQTFTLNFTVRGSQAGPYSFTLPPDAEVKTFTVDGQAMPLAAAGGPGLTAPLSAGAHEIAVLWTEARGVSSALSTPALDLELETANIALNIKLPEDRWVLWTGGPLNGPAVQFWPLLAVLLLIARVLGRAQTPLSKGAWFLLGLGLIQLHIVGAMVVAAWLLALGWRQRHGATMSRPAFNAFQILLTLWTLIALCLIYNGIQYGLLANPDMLIAGGGSYGQQLSWFTDRATGPWPEAAAYSVSVWLYKAVMLAWSLWLAVNLIRWLKWGWAIFSGPTLWKKRPKADKTQESGEK